MKSKYKKLEELYSKIPDIECKGLCHPSCTIIPAAKIEIKRARERMKGKNPFNPIKSIQKGKIQQGFNACAALKNKRCSIYNARPAICRLYGVSEGLVCPFGCLPKKTLSKTESFDLIREIEAL